MMRSQLKPQDDDLTQELLQLQQYKQTIGTPAELHNEQLTEQVKTLQLQLETYSNEVDKLKNEKADLVEDLQILKQSSETLHEHRYSLQHQDQILEKLETYYEESQRQIQRDSDRIKELERENKRLSDENEQYALILDKLEKEEISLKGKIYKESQQLRELKADYEALDIEYHSQKAFAKQTTVKAQALQSQVADLTRSYQSSLDNMHKDPADTELFAYQKTMRFAAPRTMILSNVFDKSELSELAQRNTARWHRLSLLNAQSATYPQYVESYDSERSAVSGHDEDAKEAKDYGYDNVVKEMEQQLQSEYDEMLGEERGKLMEQHRFEINELNQQIIKFKKIAMEKSENLNGGKNERNRFKQRPNNEPDLAKCKVFGWSAW